MSRIAANDAWPPRRQTAPEDVRALVFDMGDVLYDATLWRRWLWQALARAGLAIGYRELFAIWDRDFLNDAHCGKRDYREAFVAFLLSLGLSRGLVEEMAAASQAKARELAAGLRPLPGVKQTLHRLHLCGMPMAVLSDSESPGKQLAVRLDSLDIGRCFSAVISSRDLQCTKPAKACYDAAIAALGAETAETAFVGHDAEEIEGAKAAGLFTIAVNHEADLAADWPLDRFEMLLELLPSQVGNAAAG